MVEPWNDPNLEPPPNNTFYGSHFIDIQGFMHAFNNIENVLSRQLPLYNEAAILNRFVYKFDKKFRTDIGYRNLRKVKTAVQRCLSLNLLKDVKNFNSVLPKNDEDNYLPTRQMLQYMLIRIITFSKVIRRICICSKLTAMFYMDRVKRGESHWMSLMPFALLSRLWSLSLVLLQHCCSWYSFLYPYLDKLQLKGVEYLPADYSLPMDLKQWLDIENIDSACHFQWLHQKKVGINLGITEDDTLNFENILSFVKDLNSNEQQYDSSDDVRVKLSPKSNNVYVKTSDEGQSISREYFQSLSNPSKEKIKLHSVDTVTSKTTLEYFIAKEEMYRNQENNQSLTKHLSFMQWLSLKSSLLKLCDTLSHNRKIERKFKKIWREKCLDCG